MYIVTFEDSCSVHYAETQAEVNALAETFGLIDAIKELTPHEITAQCLVELGYSSKEALRKVREGLAYAFPQDELELVAGLCDTTVEEWVSHTRKVTLSHTDYYVDIFN